MAHEKHSTWNRQIWHPRKMMPYKNRTSCEKNTQRLLAKGWVEWSLKGNF